MDYALDFKARSTRRTRIRKRKKPVVLKLLILAIIGLSMYELMYKRFINKPEIPSNDNNTPNIEISVNELPSTEEAKEILELAEQYKNMSGEENEAIYLALNKIIENFDEYPDEYITLALKNHETIEFVADYINYRNLRSTRIDISNDIPKEGLPHFIQWDKRWGYSKYGKTNELISIAGCGPTALSMVVVGLTGRTDVNPKTMAEFSYENNYYVNGVGTSWALMSEGAKQFNLSVKELPMSESIIKEALNNGTPVIASMRPGTFTDVGHFIVLTGVDKNGKIIVKDPNSYIKSDQTWDFSVFEKEARNFWAFSSEK